MKQVEDKRETLQKLHKLVENYSLTIRVLRHHLERLIDKRRQKNFLLDKEDLENYIQSLADLYVRKNGGSQLKAAKEISEKFQISHMTVYLWIKKATMAKCM